MADDFLNLLTGNPLFYQGELVLRCSGCQNPLLDRVMLKINDQLWHPSCLRCSDCQIPLTEKCYSKDSINFCKEHFFRKYGTPCSGCGKGIIPLEMVRKVRDLVFHIQCFVCLLCGRELATGDNFFLMEGKKLICQADYAAASEIVSNGANKRPRTSISSSQLEALKSAYKRSAKPSRYLREQLAAETGLDMRVVQVWFQNRRAKEKRLKKEAKKPYWEKKICASKAAEYVKSEMQTYTVNTTQSEKQEENLADWLFSAPEFKITLLEQILYSQANNFITF